MKSSTREGISAAEAPHAPLGFAPYVNTHGGTQEIKLSMSAIDTSFDTAENIPDHVRVLGKQALYHELFKQANRNNIDKAVWQRLQQQLANGPAPDELIEIIRDNGDKHIHTAELARLTHVGEKNVIDRIHAPVYESLSASPSLDTRSIISRAEIDILPMMTPDLIAIEKKQEAFSHLQGSIITSCRNLYLIDMLNKDNPLRAKSADIEKIMRATLDGPDLPDWAFPALTTYWAVHAERLAQLSAEHRRSSPNMPIYKYSSIKPETT